MVALPEIKNRIEENMLEEPIIKEASQLKRYLFSKRSVKGKKKLTIEGKLAFKTARSLETLQYGYLELHNDVIKQIYSYIKELENIEKNLIVGIPLDRIFLEKTIKYLTNYLEKIRKEIITNMLDLVKIFNKKISKLDSINIEKERKRLNLIVRKAELEFDGYNYINTKDNNINVSSSSSTSTSVQDVLSSDGKANSIEDIVSNFSKFGSNIDNMLNNSIVSSFGNNFMQINDSQIIEENWESYL